jgi:hypothetical protein
MTARAFVTRSWRVLLYAALIVASVLCASHESVKFIYTEF